MEPTSTGEAWLTRANSHFQGHFIVWEGAPGARMPWKGHNRHVFLFRNHLVICKPRRDSRTDTFSYVFRNMMKVCTCRGCRGLRRRSGCAVGGGLFASQALGWVLVASPLATVAG